MVVNDQWVSTRPVPEPGSVQPAMTAENAKAIAADRAAESELRMDTPRAGLVQMLYLSAETREPSLELSPRLSRWELRRRRQASGAGRDPRPPAQEAGALRRDRHPCRARAL